MTSGLSLLGGGLNITEEVTGSQVDLTVGSATISNGTSGRVLYDNAGILGELATTGSSSVVLSTSPTITTPTISGALTYGGVTLSSSVTGTGDMVLATSPTITTPTISGALATQGGITTAATTTSSSTTRCLVTNGVVLGTVDMGFLTTSTYICEIFIPNTATFTGIGIFNGGTVSGNIKLSLANNSGAPIASTATASTAQSGTSTIQRIPFAGGTVSLPGPCTYYVMVQADNTTARVKSHTIGTAGSVEQTSTTYGTFSSFTPPTTFAVNRAPVAQLY